MKKEVISFRLNEKEFSCYIEDTVSLCEALYSRCCCGRNKEIVLVNAEAVDACRFPVVRAINQDIITTEWTEINSRAVELRSNLLPVLGESCNECSNNIIMLCLPLLAAETAPTRYKIASTLQGFLCCDVDIDLVISVLLTAYNKGRITLPVQNEKPTNSLEILDLRYAKKKDMPIQITSVESSAIPPVVASTPEPAIVLPTNNETIEKPIHFSHSTPTDEDQPALAVDTGIDDADKQIEPEVEQQAEIVPVSIFDEGFADSYEAGKKVKKNEEKPKTGFFSKFSAAFKEKHHKTLEIPEVESEE